MQAFTSRPACLRPPVQRQRLGPRLICSRRAPALRPTCSQASLQSLPEKPPALSTFDEQNKENSRRYRRTVFDFDSWASHRSTERYWRHMLGMLSSRMVRGLARPLVYVMGVATVVAVYETLYEAGMLPPQFPDLQLNGAGVGGGLTSFALSLLLVFRTNASYARWLDARKTWGLVLNRSRDLVRQGLTFIPEERTALRGMLCRWVPAFSRSLMCHLRQDSDIIAEMQGVLLPHELEEVLLADHRPSYVLQVLSEIVQEGQVSVPATLRMDENISSLVDNLGTCERILKTPIPLSYTRHTSRFMIIWLTLLPFTLWPTCHWATVPMCGLTAFLLLGIEEIGVSIEEPFSILPLEAICDSALKSAQELQVTHCAQCSATLDASDSHNGNGRAPRRPKPASALVAALSEGCGAGNGRPIKAGGEVGQVQEPLLSVGKVVL